MWSNCLFWALAEWWRRHGAWVAAGRDPETRPWLTLTSSMSRPHWVPHLGVVQFDRTTARVVLHQFRPDNPVHVPWWAPWRLLTRALFKGRPRRGDGPMTQPPKG